MKVEEQDYENTNVIHEKCPTLEFPPFVKMVKEVKTADCMFLYSYYSCQFVVC